MYLENLLLLLLPMIVYLSCCVCVCERVFHPKLLYYQQTEREREREKEREKERTVLPLLRSINSRRETPLCAIM